MAALAVLPDEALERSMAEGFGADAAGEDRFDCTLGVLCVLNVLAGNRTDAAPADPWIMRWEGWVLGQTALPQNWPESATQGAGQQEKGAPSMTRPKVAFGNGCSMP